MSDTPALPGYAVLQENPDTWPENNDGLVSSDTYLGNKKPQDAAGILEDFIDSFYSDPYNADIWQRVKNSRLALHGYPTRIDGGFSDQITQGGPQGNLAKIKVNHYRNIHQHSVNQITQEEPAFQPVAINNDSESLKQADLCLGLLDYYTRHCKLADLIERVAEDAFSDGDAFLLKEWDSNEGQPVGRDPETGLVVNSGDFRFRALVTEDVIRDITKLSYGELDWVITRDRINKFEVAARYPGLKEQILELGPAEPWAYAMRTSTATTAETDDVPVYTWFHKRTRAVPEGRMMIFCEGGLILFDGPLPYKEFPVYRVTAGDWKGTVFGYTSMWDLLSLQEFYDILSSIILSNQKTFGHQIIATQKGHDISVESIAVGLSLLEYTGTTPPEPINFTYTAPEIFAQLDRIERLFSVLSAVGPTVRGGELPDRVSGSALAAVYSQFQAYMGKFAKSFKQVQADLATGIVQDLQTFGNHERTALIAGKSKKYQMEVFSNENLNQIDRVVIENVNPLSKTMQGRVAQAEMFIQMGVVDPRAIQNVLATGTYEPDVEGYIKERDGVREENELIANGEEPPDPMITDDHKLHVSEHKGELATLRAKNDPAVRMAGLNHLQKHLMLLSDPMNVQMLTMLGQPSLAMPPMAGGPGGAPPPGGPGGSPNPHAGPPGPGSPPNGAQPAAPKNPKDPISGQRMPGGGMPTPQ
jgi:ribosomal protein S17